MQYPSQVNPYGLKHCCHDLCKSYTIGDQTSAQAWKQKLSRQLSQPLRIITVDERYGGLEARKGYWRMSFNAYTWEK